MRIAFVSSSLEPGRDGVGDYTRLLAEECRRQGHECCTIALHDQYVSEPQSDSPTHLRLPATLPWPERIRIAQQSLTDFAPDWISLQFVPYAFDPKGLVFGLAQTLLPLFQGRQTQIMFHELWIGEPTVSPLRHRLVGAVQRRLILALVRQLRPRLVHTSNETYVAILARDGVTAKKLPLFGNIPVYGQDADWLFSELCKQGIEITAASRHQFWMTGFFGGLPPEWPPEPVLTTVHQAAVQQKRRVVIISVGNLVSGEPLWEELKRRYSPQFTFLKLGRLSADRVSQILQEIDFGLSTTAYSRVGKSGSVAAMLDHGLPVIVNQEEAYRKVRLSPTSDEPLLHRLREVQGQFDKILLRQQPQSRLPEIATQFISDLQQAVPC